MDAKHTLGPWMVEADFINDDVSPDYLRITAPGADVASGILIDADARLIAAAPDLLAALVDARTYVNAIAFSAADSKKARNYSDAVDRIDAAIAKATGA